MNKEELVKNELTKNVFLILAASKNLQLSLAICNNLWKQKNELSFDDLSQFEALCSRFARLSDIYIHKNYLSLSLFF